MTSRNESEVNDSGEAAGRKPYSPPRILSREPLEAMANVCSPRPPAKANPGQCNLGPINS
jgi:hypothetical protein